MTERTDDLSSRGDAIAGLADVLARAGSPAAALEAARQAIACYERKGDVVSAARIRKLVDIAAPG
jgi:hypothetical protein